MACPLVRVIINSVAKSRSTTSQSARWQSTAPTQNLWEKSAFDWRMFLADTLYEVGFVLQFAFWAHPYIHYVKKLSIDTHSGIAREGVIPYELGCVLLFAPGYKMTSALEPPRPQNIFYKIFGILYIWYSAFFASTITIVVLLAILAGIANRVTRLHEGTSRTIISGPSRPPDEGTDHTKRVARMWLSWLFAICNLCGAIYYYVYEYDAAGTFQPTWAEWLG